MTRFARTSPRQWRGCSSRPGNPSSYGWATAKARSLQLMLHARQHPSAQQVKGIVAIGSPSTLRFQRSKLRLLVPLAYVVLFFFGRLPFRGSGPLLSPLAPVLHHAGGRFETLLGMNRPTSLRPIFASIFEDVSGGVLRQMLTWVKHKDGALLGTDGFVYEDHYDRITAPLLLIASSAICSRRPRRWSGCARGRGARTSSSSWPAAPPASRPTTGAGDLVLGERAPEEISRRS